MKRFIPSQVNVNRPRSKTPVQTGTAANFGVSTHEDIFAVFDPGERVAWILRLVKLGAAGEGPALDVVEINRPDDLGEIADLGMRLEETQRLLAGLQQAIVATQVRARAARLPACSRCGGNCRVKDYQEQVVAALFGQVRVRLPRFRCAACGGIEAGVG
jgi:hypothetical protein